LRRIGSLLFLLTLPLLADEGMWLFNEFPKDKVKQKYGVDLTPAFLDHLRLASVRAGASGSFVSPKGLIFTNHHVVLGCVQDVSTKEHDYVANGFIAKTQDQELKCPGAEANVLLKIEDVTAKVKAAIKAEPGSAEANRQRKVELSSLENECSTRTGNRCQAVTLYGGAQTHLYEYRKYTDLRLVFAPEFQTGFFGGDPDNFTYPRYDLDIGFFRAYENGKPANTPEYLKFSHEGVKNHEVVFVSGNPGNTERLLTYAELEYYRDVRFPFSLHRLDSAIKSLEKYESQSSENQRVAKETLFMLQNSYKAQFGEYGGLKDPKLMSAKRADETKLRNAIAANPANAAKYGKLWDEIGASLQQARVNYLRRALLEGGPIGADLFQYARGVLRLPVEKAKPADQRLREYSGSGLPSLENRLFANAPVSKTMNVALLADYFTLLRDSLGANDELVKKVLAGRTPEQAADAYVTHTKLDDPAERKRLAASVEAVNASNDSMLVLAKILDQPARDIRKKFEDTVEAVLNADKPKLAEAHFAAFGANEAPDATFTLRLSYGEVKGYEDDRGKQVPYATNFEGLYKRATGKDPYILAPSWLNAKSKLDLSTPFDFVSTADIIGGNSGSPTVNAKGEIVGIVFDGNIQSLPNDFQYTDTQARAVHVSSQAIVEALKKVYTADRLVDELGVR
jgi:peptidase S46-like protein